jgi:hypothetical protein
VGKDDEPLKGYFVAEDRGVAFAGVKVVVEYETCIVIPRVQCQSVTQVEKANETKHPS